MAKFVLTAQVRLAAPTNTTQVVNQIRRQFANITANVNVKVSPQAASKAKQVSNALTSVKTSANAAAGSLQKFGKDSALAIRRFGAFVTATFAFRKLVGAIGDGFDEAIKFERELVKIAQVTDRTTKNLSGLTSEISRLSTNFGVSSAKLLQASRILAQTGLSAKATEKSLQALAKSDLAPTFDNIINTTEGAIAIFRQFRLESEKLEGVLGSINAVSSKFAVESSDIITAVRRTGGAFAAAGGELNELIALFTSVRATSRESAESIATGFRTIFTRLQRTRTINFLSTLGVDLRDLEGQFVGPLEAIKRLNAALKDIRTTDPRFAQIVEELGGFRQISKVIPLIQQFDQAQKALSVAQAGNTSLTKDAEKSQQALAVQIAKVREEFNLLIRKIAGSTAFKTFADSALRLASALIKVADAITPIIGVISALAIPIAAKGFAKFLGTSSKAGGQGFLSGLGFNRGGLVPGSGNRDTVPASLTPGEFVIRKKAVQRLGVDNLTSLNQGRIGFQDGGSVSSLRNLKKEDVVKTLQGKGFNLSEGVARNVANSISKGVLNDKDIETLIGKKQASAAAANPKKVRTLRVMDNLIGGLFLQKGTGSQRSEISKTLNASDLQKLPPQFRDAKVMKTNIFKGTLDGRASGIVKEEISKSLKPAIVNAASRSMQALEIPPLGVDEVSSAKRAFNKIDIRAIQGHVFEAFTSALTGAELSSSDATFDFPSTSAKQRGRMSKIFGPDPVVGQIFDAKRASTPDAFKSINRKIINSIASGLIPQSKLQLFASGGRATGTDTVPALLTPGEFVINKKSAQQIGMNNLERLNKVQKFQRGGAVGGGGGFAGAFNNPAIFLLPAVAGQLVQTFDGLNETAGKTIDAVSQLGLQFVTFQAILGSLGGSNRLQNIRAGLPGTFENQEAGLIAERRAARRDFVAQDIAGNAGPRGSVQRRIVGGRLLQANRNLQDFRRTGGGFLARNALGIGAAAGAIGNVAGGFVSSAANNRIARGQSASGTAGIGGALSGAGTGAAVGSLFGPLGIAIGGAVGAIGGFTLAFIEAEKSLKSVKFAKSIEGLATSLEKVNARNFSVASQSTAVAKGLDAFRSRLSATVDAEALEDFNGSLRNARPALDQFFIKAAQATESFADFQQLVGEDTVKTFTALNGIPFDNFQTEIEKTIAITKRSNEINEEANRVEAEFVNRLTDINALSSGLFNAVEATNKFNAAIKGFSGVGGVQNILANPAASSTNSFRDAVRSVVSTIPQAGSVGRDAIAIQGIQRALPSILNRLRSQDPLGTQNTFIPRLVEELQKIVGTGTNSKFIIDSIVSQTERIIGNEGKEENILSKLGTVQGLQEVTNRLGSAFDPTIDVLQQAGAAIQNNLNNLVSALDKRRELEFKILESTQKAVDIQERRFQFENQLRVSEGGVDRSSRISRTFDTIRQEQALVGTGVAANDPVAAGEALRKFQKQISETTKQLNDARQRGVNDEGATRRLDGLVTSSEKLKRQLEFLSDASSRTSASLDKLSKLRAEREQRLGFAVNFLTGSKEDQASQVRTIKLAQAVLLGGRNFEDLGSEDRSSVVSLLKQFGTQQNPSFGTDAATGEVRTGIQAINEIVRRSSIGGIPGLTSPSDAEREEQGNIRDALDKAEKARDEISKSFIAEQKTVIELMAEQNKQFLTELKQIFLESQIRQLESDITSREGSVNRLRTGLQATRELGIVGRTAAPEQVINEVEKLKGLTQQISRVSSLTSSLESGVNFDPELTKLGGSAKLLNAITPGASLAKLRGDDTRSFSFFDVKEEDLKGFQTNAIQLLANAGLKDLDPSAFETSRTQISQIRAGSDITDREGALKEINTKLATQLAKIVQDNFATSLNKLNKDAGTINQDLQDRGINKGVIPILIQQLDDLKKNFELSKEIESVAKAQASIRRLTEEINVLKTSADGFRSQLPKPPNKKATGGIIPGVGTTDSVRALLTPGEFVMRKAAVDAIGVQNLQTMNSTGVARFQNGGPVGGGSVNIEGAMRLQQTVIAFSNTADSLSDALNNFPREIQHTITGRVEIIHNGAEVLARIMPSVQELVTARVAEGISKFTKDNFPELGQQDI